MVRIYKTIDGAIHQIQEPEEGCWIALTNPTATEIFEFSEKFDIEVDDLRSPLDEEERSRIEVEDNYTLILVDVPMIEERNDKDWYGTIPLGIIVTKKMIFTVCLEDTQVLTRFMEGRVRNFFTYMKTRFILQKLLKVESIKQYPEDTDLLEDVIIENKQAIEMANIYSGILSSMMGTFASVISNNLNVVMKVLSVITIVMSIPTIVFSAYGMNLSPSGMPFSADKWGFLVVILLSILVSIVAAVILSKKKFF